MSSLRRTALVGGIFYLLTFIGSIPAYFLQVPVLTNPGYIVSDGSDTQVIAGSVLDLVTAFAGIGLKTHGRFGFRIVFECADIDLVVTAQMGTGLNHVAFRQKWSQRLRYGHRPAAVETLPRNTFGNRGPEVIAERHGIVLVRPF